METNSIIDEAKSIRDQRSKESLLNSERFLIDRSDKERKILEEFEFVFADLLPLLRNSDISWSAHFKTKWEYEGSYISFKHGIKELKMDFDGINSYRYEYRDPDVKSHITMIYGDWLNTPNGREDFILFIHDGLFAAPQIEALGEY